MLESYTYDNPVYAVQSRCCRVGAGAGGAAGCWACPAAAHIASTATACDTLARIGSGGDRVCRLGAAPTIDASRLEAVQPGIAFPGSHQRGVGAAFAHSTAVEVQNQVRPGGELQIVRNQESR